MMLHVFDHWNRGCFRLHSGGLPDGARPAQSADATGGVDHHRRGGTGHGADLESCPYFEADDQRADWGIWIVEVWHQALHRFPEDEYELLQKARKEGLVALETDIEAPDASPLFSTYKDFVKDHHAVAFVCDTMRMAVSGGVEVFDLDQMLEADMDVHHHEATEPVSALSTMADSLPGLGIVAAVLGVVITMGALGGPPEEIGKKVAAALVGTFLGILLCYGLVGPLASRMGKMADEQHAFMMVLRVTMIAFLKGVAPIMAVEIGRRTVPGHVRPSFAAVEEACRGAKDAPPAAAAAAAG
jgi:chemotaxis protein MotA